MGRNDAPGRPAPHEKRARRAGHAGTARMPAPPRWPLPPAHPHGLHPCAVPVGERRSGVAAGAPRSEGAAIEPRGRGDMGLPGWEAPGVGRGFARLVPSRPGGACTAAWEDTPLAQGAYRAEL